MKGLRFSHKILLVATVIVVAVFSMFSLNNYQLQRGAIEQNLESYLHGMGDSTAGNIQNWITGRLLLVQGLAQNVTLAKSTADIERLLEQPVFQKNFMGIYFGDTNGDLILRPYTAMPAGYDARQRPWYKLAQGIDGPGLTQPYLDAASKQLVIAAVVVSKGPEGDLGVVGGDLSLEALQGIINAVDFAGLGYAFLVSKEGTILVHPDKSLVLKNINDVLSAHNLSMDRRLTDVTENGHDRLVAFAKVEGLPSVEWYVGLSVDKSKAYEASTHFRDSAVVAATVAVVLIVLLLSLLMRWLLKPLHDMSAAMENIAQGEGDLTRRLAATSSDEIGLLAGSFNRFIERIHQSIGQVAVVTEEVILVSGNVLSASNASLVNSSEQSQRTSSVAAAIHELGAAAQEIAGNAALASEQATSARRLADEGQQVVDQSIHSMDLLTGLISRSGSHIENLNHKTVNIGQILDVISGISQQTNLLALNAAIEAARAGEAGRGFAVVADEVRSLAHRTQESAQQVQSMIEELQGEARSSVETMTESQSHGAASMSIASEAGKKLESVTKRIGEIDGMNQSVAAATEEQTAVVESINTDITQIDSLNQDAVRNLEATLQACRHLEQQTTSLKRLVAGFRL